MTFANEDARKASFMVKSFRFPRALPLAYVLLLGGDFRSVGVAAAAGVPGAREKKLAMEREEEDEEEEDDDEEEEEEGSFVDVDGAFIGTTNSPCSTK